MNEHLLNFVQDLELRSGEHWRGDCPNCGGINTFSVSNEFGTRLYHCYRSSCRLAGSLKGEMSYADLEQVLGNLDRSSIDRPERVFVRPEHFVDALSRPECVEYLIKNHAYEACRDGRAEVLYDVKQNRVVFLVKKDGVTYDAVGRALDRAVKPKWYRYGTSSFPFIVCANRSNERLRLGSTVAIVEDAASSCAVSMAGIDGCALLGSQLGLVDASSLVGYDTVIVALDKDASDKSIQIERYLSYYCKNVKILLLERDLKLLSPQEISHAIASILPIETQSTK